MIASNFLLNLQCMVCRKQRTITSVLLYHAMPTSTTSQTPDARKEMIAKNFPDVRA